MKFSALYSKAAAFVILIVVCLVCAGVFAAYLIRENLQLQSNVDKLVALNIEQKDLINDKAGEIQDLKGSAESINGTIEDFTNKYATLAKNYIQDRTTNVQTNRSGDTSGRSLVKDINDLKADLNSLQDLNSSDDKVLSAVTKAEDNLKEYLRSIPTLWPTSGRISSPFGGRRDPFVYNVRFHTGMDIAAPYGQNIMATADGTVIFAGRKIAYGNTVVIDHGHGLTTMYGHASKLLVKKGQKVKQGDVIAKVGSTGRSTGSHLHFQVELNGTPVDPLKYLDSK